MKKIDSIPRDDWENIINNEGLTYSVDGEWDNDHYWDESHAYVMTPRDVDMLKEATEVVVGMCYQGVEKIINDPELLAKAGFVDKRAQELVVNSWFRQTPSLFDGRLDFIPVLDNNGDMCGLKFLEFNAETPTAIVESGIVQRGWFKDVHGYDPSVYHYNELYENFVNSFSNLLSLTDNNKMFFGVVNDEADPTGEDAANAEVLSRFANEAGWDSRLFFIDEMVPRRGMDDNRVYGWRVGDHEIQHMFKIYPWVNMLSPEEGLDDVIDGYTYVDYWLEPMWKSVASSKVLLPVLWDMFVGTDKEKFLVPAFFGADTHGLKDYVLKPVSGHEGSGVVVNAPSFSAFCDNSDDTMNPRDNSDEYIVQEFVHPPDCGTDNVRYATIGCWSFHRQCAGFDIRDSSSPVIDEDCTFVPHMEKTQEDD